MMDKMDYHVTNDLLRYLSLLLIRNDCATMEMLMRHKYNSVIKMGLMPYLALACCSLSEFFGDDCFDNDKSTLIYLKEMRNSLKLWQNGFSSGTSVFRQIEDSQDSFFKNLLRFEFTKSLNIHYNIGIYFDESSHVVGNTNLLAFMFGFKNLTEKECEEKAFEIGRQTGSIIGKVYRCISEKLGYSIPALPFKNLSVRYYDTNTNAADALCAEYPKEIGLYMLHLLSLAGFANHFFTSLIPQTNPWLMRVVYVTTHYCYLGIKHMKCSLEINYPILHQKFGASLNNIVNIGEPLFSSAFRGCMMHYNLFDKKTQKPIINTENLDLSKPLFGLVETCFNGENYNSLLNSLFGFLSSVEAFLITQFKFDKALIKKLDEE